MKIWWPASFELMSFGQSDQRPVKPVGFGQPKQSQLRLGLGWRLTCTWNRHKATAWFSRQGASLVFSFLHSALWKTLSHKWYDWLLAMVSLGEQWILGQCRLDHASYFQWCPHGLPCCWVYWLLKPCLYWLIQLHDSGSTSGVRSKLNITQPNIPNI